MWFGKDALISAIVSSEARESIDAPLRRVRGARRGRLLVARVDPVHVGRVQDRRAGDEYVQDGARHRGPRPGRARGIRPGRVCGGNGRDVSPARGEWGRRLVSRRYRPLSRLCRDRSAPKLPDLLDESVHRRHPRLGVSRRTARRDGAPRDDDDHRRHHARHAGQARLGRRERALRTRHRRRLRRGRVHGRGRRDRKGRTPRRIARDVSRARVPHGGRGRGLAGDGPRVRASRPVDRAARDGRRATAARARHDARSDLRGVGVHARHRAHPANRRRDDAVVGVAGAGDPAHVGVSRRSTERPRAPRRRGRRARGWRCCSIRSVFDRTFLDGASYGESPPTGPRKNAITSSSNSSRASRSAW